MGSRIKSVSKTSKRSAVEFAFTDEDLDLVCGGGVGRAMSGGFAGASGGFVGASGGFVGASGGFVGASGGFVGATAKP